VEISKGCNLGCIYCYSACDDGYSTAQCQGNSAEVLRFYENTDEAVDRFIHQHGDHLRNVHLGYVTDFHQDHGPRAEEIRLKVLRALQQHNVNVSCLTKGMPSDAVIEEINKMADRFTLMLDVGCGDEKWETNVLPLWKRAEQISKLECNLGARMDPIIPGVSDTDEWMEHVCRTLAGIGITDIDTSFLFMTDEVVSATERVFGPEAVDEMYDKYYTTGCEEHLNGAVPWTGDKVDLEDIRYKIDVIALVTPDVDYRREKVERFQRIAKPYGITVRLCTCKNRSMKGFTGFCSDTRALACKDKVKDNHFYLEGTTDEQR
jgi:DNA repair photolyase